MIRLSDKLQLIGSAYFQQVIRIGTLFVMARFIGPQDKGIYMTLVYAAGLVMAGERLCDSAGRGADSRGAGKRCRRYGPRAQRAFVFVLRFIRDCRGLFSHASRCKPQPAVLAHRPNIRGDEFSHLAVQRAAGAPEPQARIPRREPPELDLRAQHGRHWNYFRRPPLRRITRFGGSQLLAGQLAANVAINLRVPLSWPRQVSWHVARRFFTLGAPASIATYIRAVEAPVIGLIITPISGAIGLGLWSQAIQVQQMFGQNLLASFQRVAYPMVCQSVSDEERIRKLFARITLMLMMISLWFTVVVGINSEALVRICLGRSWVSTAPLLRITAWAIPAGALDMVANIMCMALGISKSFILSAVLNLVLFIPAALIVRQLGGGLVGLAMCWSVSRYLIALTTIDAVQRKIRFGLRDIARPLAALFVAGVAACAAMIAIRLPLGQLRLPIQFAIIGFLGSIVYMFGVWFLEPSTVRDAMNMARGRAAGENPQPLEETLVGTTENPAGEQGELWASSQSRTEPSKLTESTQMSLAALLRKNHP